MTSRPIPKHGVQLKSTHAYSVAREIHRGPSSKATHDRVSTCEHVSATATDIEAADYEDSAGGMLTTFKLAMDTIYAGI